MQAGLGQGLGLIRKTCASRVRAGARARVVLCGTHLTDLSIVFCTLQHYKDKMQHHKAREIGTKFSNVCKLLEAHHILFPCGWEYHIATI